MHYSDSSGLADARALRPRCGRRLVVYLSLTLFVPLFVGLAVRLGASAPAKTPPQSPGVEARVSRYTPAAGVGASGPALARPAPGGQRGACGPTSGVGTSGRRVAGGGRTWAGGTA
jgi:hypothetical protein